MSTNSKIFLSSTSSDLEEHRKVVRFTLDRLRRWVEAMEYFGALPGEPLEECLKLLRSTRFYVGVIGTRYGDCDESGVSFTQREYEEAFRCEKHILIYLIDNKNHPVLPMNVDVGKSATKLKQFKALLQKRHTCVSFSSPQDLAIQIAVDLLRAFGGEAASIEPKIAEAKKELPTLLAEAGYSLTFGQHFADLSQIFSRAEIDGRLKIEDPRMENILSAGFLAVNLSKGDFATLRDIMTFDRSYWLLFLSLIEYCGIPSAALAKAISKTADAVQLRLLIKLAGELKVVDCVEPICRITLRDLADFERRIINMQMGAVTPFDDVVKQALGSMPESTIPTLERFAEEAKRLKRWKQKQIFQASMQAIKRRIKRSGIQM